MLLIYFHIDLLNISISNHHLRCEKRPIVEFSCNVKTARPHLKTDTIAAIDKKKLLRARASVHKQLEYYSFQNFEYDYIMMRANRARKVWLNVGL